MGFEGEGLLNEFIERYSNWGRWGEDDSIGTINFVGAEQVLAAVATVRHGRTVSCTLPLDQKGPQRSDLLRDNPRTVKVATGTDHVSGAQDQLPAGLGPANGFGRSDDITILPNQAGTAWDGLAHIFWEGKMWNGRSAALVSASGAAANGVEHYAGKMVFRGVLLDMPDAMGVESLEPARAITIEDLERAEAKAGVEVKRGDCILLRTGFMRVRRGNWRDYVQGPAPVYRSTQSPGYLSGRLLPSPPTPGALKSSRERWGCSTRFTSSAWSTWDSLSARSSTSRNWRGFVRRQANSNACSLPLYFRSQELRARQPAP